MKKWVKLLSASAPLSAVKTRAMYRPALIRAMSKERWKKLTGMKMTPNWRNRAQK